jgi:tRNA (guanine-N7-)-methyltransferase
MRLRNIKNSNEIIKNSNYIINNESEYRGKWNNVFNNNNPIHIEIGMGKGKFILENSLRYPDINFIGIEKYDSVMVRALKKIDKYNISNLKLIRCDAMELNSIFDCEIDIIYLNFSDPWPKEKHSKRRLTSELFLSVYDKVFKGNKTIIMKTDNRNLFEYSITSFSNNGYIIKNISLDLHNSNISSIITTEYEEKFIKNNIKIYYMECFKE